MPTKPDFNRLYSEYCRDKYDSKNGEKMFEHLEEKIKKYREQSPESNVHFQQYEEIGESIQPFILVIVTPLMRRIHEMV